MTIQAIFFDMGGTVETFWHDRQLRLDATPGLRQKLWEAGIDLSLKDEQLLEMVSAGLDRYHRWCLGTLEELPAETVWRDYILADSPVDSSGLSTHAEDLMQYFETHFYHREMRPEMPTVLDAIRSMGLKIGLISNVCSRGQVPSSLRKYDLSSYFDPVVLSSEYGRRKPDPAIFHYAARLANMPTSRCAFVGDLLSRDIAGAHRAGYRLAIKIHHEFGLNETDHGPVPDATIHHMTELLEILQEEMARPDNDRLRPTGVHDHVRALVFDAGDVLYSRPNQGHKLAAFFREIGLDPKAVSKGQKQALKAQAFQGLISYDQYREKLLRLYGITQSDQVERGKRIMELENHEILFFDKVRDTLTALKERGYLLGIITDTANPVHVKLRWFEQGGFGHVWDSIISSQELSVQKPSPLIYQAALTQLGLPAEQVAFVGHDARELRGAREIGMKTVAYNYEEGTIADFYVEDFADILSVPVIGAATKPS